MGAGSLNAPFVPIPPPMFTRDVLLRQVHQLVHAISRVLRAREQGSYEEALVEINRGLAELPGGSGRFYRSLDAPDLLAACCYEGGTLVVEKALAVADLLRLEAEVLFTLGKQHARESARRALWLYEAARAEAGAMMPFDIDHRIDTAAELARGEYSEE
jgi:hypothetical protein